MKKTIKIFSIIFALLILLCSCDGINTPSVDTELPTQDTPADNGCVHSDEDDNGKCDICTVSLIVSIDFYAVNDLHGKFVDTESNGGVDELTTYLKAMYKSDDNVVLLSSGDMWQGGAESNLTRGMIITEWMNHLDFVSMTLGNHEYDWGEEYIEINDEIAEFPFLAINAFDKETNKRVEYCDASVIIERGGIEIGIIGAIGDCYSSISADKSGDFYFKTGAELTRLVKDEADRLRSLGVDFIVYSIHDGSEESGGSYASSSQLSSYYDISLSDGYIDLVFEGHTHQKYSFVDEHGVYHLQNGGENKGISHVELRINSVTNTAKVKDAEFVSSSLYSNLDDDEIVNDLLEKYKDEVAVADNVLGQNGKRRDSEEIEALVAMLYYKAGLEKWGASYNIVLGGGFVRTRSPYDLSAGNITYRDVLSVLPFDNQIVLCSIKGSDLKSKFFETDNKDYHIYYEAYGKEIKDNIKSNETYYIIVDSYTSSYAWNRLTVVEEYSSDVFARDLIAEYIASGAWK